MEIVAKKSASKPTTLAVDIGGTGMKLMVLDSTGKPLCERVRVPTPDPPTPKNVLATLNSMKAGVPAFDRVSVGFPGVVKQGKTFTAANLGPEWIGYPLQKVLTEEWGKPVRVANDCAVQGYAAIKGKGVELMLTLGTGMGSAIFTDGRLCPGLELAHHEWRKGHTYEDYLGRKGYKKQGEARWNKLVLRAIDSTFKLFNWDALYIGGGNAKKLSVKLPANVTIVPNEDGVLGGVALWRHADEDMPSVESKGSAKS